MSRFESLEADKLYRVCDPQQFTFTSTEELEPIKSIVGQERAIAAVQFGIGIRQEGYNLFAAGVNGTGKYTAVSRYLERQAKEMPVPSDWCYVYNFEQPHKPTALSLPAGRGMGLSQDMEELVEELYTVIPAAFEAEEYQTQKETITEEAQKKQEEAFKELAERAQEHDIALIRTPAGFGFAPIKDDEQTLSPQEFRALPEEEREEIQAVIEDLQEDLQKILRQISRWGQKGREEIKELNRQVISFAISPLLQELMDKYADFKPVQQYLQQVQEDIIENVNKLIGVSSQPGSLAGAMAGEAEQEEDQPSAASERAAFVERYKVNVLVDHSQATGAPVVYEDFPTHQNLIGRIEHVSRMGALLTNFTLIKPGALHRANGGYLILDARKLLMQPYAWEGLKRALRADCLYIEPLGQSLSLISTVSLEPEPIPLDVKVVLLGEHYLYYLLHQADPEFGELFKVMADFTTEMERNEAGIHEYARLLTLLVKKNDLHHLNREAVARVIEYSSRVTSDTEKLSVHMQHIVDLMREASYWAGQADHDLVEAADVQKAIDEQKYRHGRLRERVQEMIVRETILIDTEGAQIGQINGLSVLQVGQQTFGRPNRITARVRLGKGEVVDIERQVEMGGPLHSKGVMILTGFLGGRYAAERPLSLSASLVFEQSYGGVDGDSASSAELYALISALAEVPIKQSLAVTGSVNQHGMVQAIGGVNEKIEGFFDICQSRDLTGEQGVLIPAANVKNLMLRQDVVQAVAEGQFHIYAVSTIDQGIEILTGVPAGEPDDDGRYPPDTVNQRVADRLELLEQKARELNQPAAGQQNE